MSRYDVIQERGRDACDPESSRRRDSRMMRRSGARPGKHGAFLVFSLIRQGKKQRERKE